jgi:hypothetical protein
MFSVFLLASCLDGILYRCLAYDKFVVCSYNVDVRLLRVNDLVCTGFLMLGVVDCSMLEM